MASDTFGYEITSRTLMIATAFHGLQAFARENMRAVRINYRICYGGLRVLYDLDIMSQNFLSYIPPDHTLSKLELINLHPTRKKASLSFADSSGHMTQKSEADDW